MRKDFAPVVSSSNSEGGKDGRGGEPKRKKRLTEKQLYE
jgi:hypothetical protein